MKNRLLARILLVTVVALILAIIGVGVNKYLNPNVGFTYLEPTYLPPGVSIKAKRIDMYRGHVQAVELDFRKVDWVYSIGESGSVGSPSAADIAKHVGTAPQNYDASSVKPTCSLLNSPGGQHYRLCHWIDYGRIGVYQVRFVKDNTSLAIMIPATLQQHITVAQISRFVDSFTPKSTFGIPVLRSNGV